MDPTWQVHKLTHSGGGSSMYKTCPNSSQTKSQHGGGSRHKDPPLSKKLLTNDSLQERKNRFPLRICPCQVNQSAKQTLHQWVVDGEKEGYKWLPKLISELEVCFFSCNFSSGYFYHKIGKLSSSSDFSFLFFSFWRWGEVQILFISSFIRFYKVHHQCV